MKKTFLIIFFICLNNFLFFNLEAKINNVIVAKVGKLLVTSLDIRDEILTYLIINNQEISQENINKSKNFALKNLINKAIKTNEINKFQITNYSQNDLRKYIEKVSNNLNVSTSELKNIFKINNISYEEFVEKHITELKWNTLIFSLYKNQININIIEVDNEIKQVKEDQDPKELKKIKENILNRKKEEKLNLFSRSHFSNLENSINIKFNE
jgi:hypothetical protein|tara:strand:- start:606 stop:1241 length:636 start_codon:yes stop_codon:yes gene_type:complete